MSEDGAATTEAQTDGETSEKTGGSQFFVKMIFLALIVLAIVFYVRSLDHKAVPVAGHQSSAEMAPGQATEHPAATAATQAPAESAGEAPAAASAPADTLTSESAMQEIQSLFAPSAAK